MKLFFIFFALFLSFMIEPQAFLVQDVQSVNYIQNVKAETTVLVSNNFLGGDIYSYQEDSSQNFLGSTPAIAHLVEKNDYLIKNKAQLLGCFIHTLSTNLKEVQQIRAP